MKELNILLSELGISKVRLAKYLGVSRIISFEWDFSNRDQSVDEVWFPISSKCYLRVKSKEIFLKYPYIQSIYPGISDPVILEIRREREIELILEGLRLNDLKRWACGNLWETSPWDGIYIPALDTPLDLNGDGTYDVYVTEDTGYSGSYKSIAMTMEGNQQAVKLEDDPEGGYKLNYAISREWNDNMYIYPIPEVVIQKNTNLKQNPGWN